MSMYYSYKNIPKQSFGGKADGLLLLCKKGFRVPSFYIIPNTTIQSIISGKYTITSLCTEWIENVHPEKESLWAVRSSAEVEDGKNKSYAGMFTTEINCKPEVLEIAFEKVIAGFKRVQKEIPEYHQTGNFRFNIVLQQMICGELSGVGFSVDPLAQVSDNPIINIIPGLGFKLVSGEENAMVIDLTNQPKIISEDEQYHGALYESVSGYKKVVYTKKELFKKVTPCLQELRKSLIKIDDVLGYPVDTEFTIYKNQIYWLQARPITKLIPRGDHIVWDNSNMDVNYPGVIMPLTVSFVQHSYSNAYINMCRFLGAGDSFIKKNNSLFKNTIGVIKGGMYYNITAYQQLLYQLPFGKKTSKLFTKALGAEDASFQKPSQSASFIIYLRLFINLARSVLFSKYYKKKYVTQFDKIQKEFENTSLQKQTHAELIEYFKVLETKLSAHWHVPILNSLFTMVAYNNLNKILSRSKLHQKHPNFLNDSLMGSGRIVSMEIVCALQDLMYRLCQNSDVKKAIIERESKRVLPYLKKNHPEHFDLIMSYIQQYGERSDEGELKIETVNYKEDPTKFVTFLKSNVSISQSRITVKERFDYTRILKETYKTNLFKQLLFKIVINFTIKGVRDRENFRFIRTKTFDMVRQIFREVDHKLLKNETILHSGDSLYLNFHELVDPNLWGSRYKHLIDERKEVYASFQEIEHPIRYHEVNNELFAINRKSTSF